MPARSMSRIAISVASSCACSRWCSSTRHSSRARTRGGSRLPRRSRVVSDVRVRDDVAAAVEAARDRFGGLDVVLANAAVSIYREFEHESEETIDLILDTNLKGALLCAQLAIPELKRRGGGSIIFVSSVQACVTLPGSVPYAAAKAGLVAATRALAPEV